MINPALQLDIIAEANLAPSVHNTQPARWRFDGETISLFADLNKCLAIGDPMLRDAGLSCGAALEGTIMALGKAGFNAVSIQDYWPAEDISTFADHRLAATITIAAGKPKTDPYDHYVPKRFTWRGAFAPIATETQISFKQWGAQNVDICLITESDAITDIARLNDQASLGFFKNRAYREELLSYMRLSPAHPLYMQDGLNRDAMHLSKFEAMAAGTILKYPLFEMVSAIGLAKPIISEFDKTCSAGGIAFFLSEPGASPIDIGRAFYRRWLEITALGLTAWPMAVIADDPKINQILTARYDLADKRLVNAWRIGGLPDDAQIKPARFDPADLII